MLQAVLRLISGFLPIRYLVLDGHFGNYPSAWLTRQAGLHLISKLRSDAALFEPFTGKYQGPGRPTKYGVKIQARRMKKKYLKETTTAEGLRTDIYQAPLLNKECLFPLNVVIIVKTNLTTQAQSHVILFSTDLDLTFTQLINFYRLRFQIEFNVRDAKQYWGLDDFMNVEPAAVTTAANLSFFMVNLSQVLLAKMRRSNAAYSVLDLKAHYHGCRYTLETLKLLPQKPDAILLATIFEQIARMGMIHPVFQPVVPS